MLPASLAPPLEQNMEPVVPLLGRIMSEPNQFIERVYKKHLQPVARRFQEEIGRALPDLPPAERQWRLYFMVGVKTHILSWSHVLPELSHGLCDVTERQGILERAGALIAAGIFFAAAPPPLTGRAPAKMMSNREGD